MKYCFLGFDPGTFLNQLNNLQANQIDDLESALLPHLHGNFIHLISCIIYCNKMMSLAPHVIHYDEENYLYSWCNFIQNMSTLKYFEISLSSIHFLFYSDVFKL